MFQRPVEHHRNRGGRAGALRIFGGRRECRHIRHHRHFDGAPSPRADRPRPACRRLHVRWNDLRHELLLHDLSGIERLSASHGLELSDHRSLPRLPLAGPRFRVAVGSEKLWSAFCKAIDRLDLQHHPDFATNALRVRHRAAMEEILFEVFRQRPAQEWLAKLRAAGVPCSLVRNLREVVDDPQSAFRGMFPVIDHPTIGPHRVTGTADQVFRHARRPFHSGPVFGPTHAVGTCRAARSRRIDRRRPVTPRRDL